MSIMELMELRNLLENGHFVYTTKKKTRLIISRDTLGKQPLYYYIDDHTIVLSSEIKSILNLLKKRILKKEYINNFLNYGYIQMILKKQCIKVYIKFFQEL